MTISRRTLLAGAASVAAPASAFSGVAASPLPPHPESPRIASDEAYWREIAAAYDVTPDIVNLENGNWGLMARPVLAAYEAHTRRVNRENSYYARRTFSADMEAVQARLAEAVGAGTDELVLTRGASEALIALISQYAGLTSGAALMIADLDYGSMQDAMAMRAAKAGCELIRLEVPEPATHDGLIAFYAEALDNHPKTKLLLLTHLSHRTGLMLPVAPIVAAARARGVDVIVDAAHSFGQTPFRLGDLGADFVGLNMHKWIGAPVGVGAMYIRRERLGDIAPAPGSSAWEAERISGRVHTGTTNFAAFLALADALEFHDAVGVEAKSARLRYLRSIWVEAAQGIAGVDILTPDDDRLHAGMTSFRLRGRSSVGDNAAIAGRLLTEHGVFTVHRDGVARGACVRVTPALYNSPSDCERLVSALRALA